MMEELFDGRFTYPGLWPNQRCWCRLRVYREPGMARLLMVATEAADNPGASVTNAAEGLWSAAWQRFQPEQGSPPLCFEHYGHESQQGGRRHGGETVDLVEFTAFAVLACEVTGPRWSRFAIPLLNRMVGRQVADPFPLEEETTDPAELPTVDEWLQAGAPMREVDP